MDAIKCIYGSKDVFLWLPTGFGTSICHETAVCFKYKHSDGETGGGCSVVLVVSPLVSLINYGSHRRINTAATTAAVYLFLCITTMCNLSIIGLVREKFPESFAHAQTGMAKLSGKSYESLT